MSTDQLMVKQGATVTGEASGEHFGYSVSISATGDTIVVGAWGANSDTGTAYIFDLQPEGVSKVPENQSNSSQSSTQDRST
jgi:hypothetical protein